MFTWAQVDMKNNQKYFLKIPASLFQWLNNYTSSLSGPCIHVNIDQVFAMWMDRIETLVRLNWLFSSFASVTAICQVFNSPGYKLFSVRQKLETGTQKLHIEIGMALTDDCVQTFSCTYNSVCMHANFFKWTWSTHQSSRSWAAWKRPQTKEVIPPS